MVSEFAYPYHGRMVDFDTREPSRVYLKNGKKNNGYWTGENVANQLRTVHIMFDKLHPECLDLYIFDNSANHPKIATDTLNAHKLNLKEGGKNTRLFRDGFYMNESGERVAHAIQTEDGIQKELCAI